MGLLSTTTTTRTNPTTIVESSLAIMERAKEYDWKDSNMALFGSDTEKSVKKESAEAEPAWAVAGKEPGLQIWRIVKFQVTEWEKEQYGEFYEGDSYIILNTWTEEDCEGLKYDVHFWIGKYSTQDEYGTAAYKTVELDTYLGDAPIQHREVQGHESTLFKSYFESISLLKGGADSGFRRVVPEAYEPRLFHVQRQKDRKKTVVQVDLLRGNLKSEDAFVIDNGLHVYQWNGSKCSADEKFKAAAVVSDIASKRAGCKTHKLEERATKDDHPAMMLLKAGETEAKEEIKGTKEMFRVSDEDGSLDLDPVDGYGRDRLESKDVFFVNSGEHVYCWIGKEASVDERKNALS